MIKKDLATIEGHLEPLNHEAAAITFDNSTNGFAATDVQTAIEEAKSAASSTTIPEYNVDPVSPPTNSAWVLKSIVDSGSPVGLLLALTENTPTTIYELSYKTVSGSVARTELKV